MTLVDKYARKIEYLRLSVTDRCDLRCVYCLPKGYKDFQEPEEWLRFDEIVRIVKAFSELGVMRIRLTGGEPLVRRKLSQLAADIASIPGISDLSLSTNAIQLGRYAQSLKDAGVTRLNVSLDSLNEDNYKSITNGGLLHKALDGLDKAKHTGFQPIKINMVVMKGVNDHEIFDMVEFCIRNQFTLRFIETMPMGSTGLSASSQYLDLNIVRQQLAERYEIIPGMMPGGGPARYVQIAGTELRIGFITPISQHFCETCNRVRLAADGRLHLCLGQTNSVDLRTLLRQGINDQDLKQSIVEAIDLKPERHEFREKPGQIVRFMSSTGG